MSESSDKSLLEENMALKRRLQHLEELFQEQATKLEMLKAREEASKATPSQGTPSPKKSQALRARETVQMLIFAEQNKIPYPPGGLTEEEALANWEAHRRRTSPPEEIAVQDEE